MLSIVYSSAAERPFSETELEQLLLQSRESNAAEGLTGLLVHRDGRFLQLLEGPDEAVRARMAVIEQDSRHGQLRVLLEDEIQQRQFPDWTMGFQTVTGAAIEVPGYRRTFDDVDAGRSVSGTLPALRALLAWFRQQHDQ